MHLVKLRLLISKFYLKYQQFVQICRFTNPFWKLIMYGITLVVKMHISSRAGHLVEKFN